MPLNTNSLLVSVRAESREQASTAMAMATQSAPLDPEDEESHPAIWHELKNVAQTLDRLVRLSMWMSISTTNPTGRKSSAKISEAKNIAERSVRDFLTQLRLATGSSSRSQFSAAPKSDDDHFLSRLAEAHTSRLLLLSEAKEVTTARNSDASQASIHSIQQKPKSLVPSSSKAAPKSPGISHGSPINDLQCSLCGERDVHWLTDNTAYVYDFLQPIWRLASIC